MLVVFAALAARWAWETNPRFLAVSATVIVASVAVGAAVYVWGWWVLGAVIGCAVISLLSFAVGAFFGTSNLEDRSFWVAIFDNCRPKDFKRMVDAFCGGLAANGLLHALQSHLEQHSADSSSDEVDRG